LPPAGSLRRPPNGIETIIELAMSILNRYLTREILKYFSIVLTLVLVLFVAVDYLGTMDEFLEAGISLVRALYFVALKLPFMIVMFIPVGILLSVLIVFGLMTKNNEMMALKSSGVSIYSLFKPVFLIGCAGGAVLLILSEVVAPITMAEANRIQKQEIRKSAVVTTREKNIWIKGNRQIIHIKYFNPNEAVVYGISLNVFDPKFHLIRRIDAQRGVFRDGTWRLSNLLDQRYDSATDSYSVRFVKERTEAIDIAPADLKKVVKKSEAMSFRELYGYIRKIEAEGYDATAYRVDLQAKLAFPFVCLIMSMVGVGIAARSRIVRGLPASLALGIGTAFLYWIFYSFCLSLGRGEVLPPWIAAWSANFVFFCAGLIGLQGAE
jgi:lipopolysaccharide export system permease protein